MSAFGRSRPRPQWQGRGSVQIIRRVRQVGRRVVAVVDERQCGTLTTDSDATKTATREVRRRPGRKGAGSNTPSGKREHNRGALDRCLKTRRDVGSATGQPPVAQSSCRRRRLRGDAVHERPNRCQPFDEAARTARAASGDSRGRNPVARFRAATRTRWRNFSPPATACGGRPSASPRQARGRGAGER